MNYYSGKKQIFSFKDCQVTANICMFFCFVLAKPHEKAVHLHALETLKVVIGVTTPGHGDHNGQTNHNGSVDQENNKLTAYTNGHITSDNGGFVLNEGSSDIAVSRVSPITPETPDGEDKKEEVCNIELKGM